MKALMVVLATVCLAGCISIQRPTTVYIVVTNQVQQVAPSPQYSFPSWTVPTPQQAWPMWGTNGILGFTNNALVECNGERVRW